MHLRLQEYFLKDTHKEKAPSNKTPANVDMWMVLLQINSLYEVLKLKQNFRKNGVVTSKTLFFVIGPFCTSQSICFNIGF